MPWTTEYAALTAHLGMCATCRLGWPRCCNQGLALHRRLRARVLPRVRRAARMILRDHERPTPYESDAHHEIALSDLRNVGLFTQLPGLTGRSGTVPGIPVEVRPNAELEGSGLGFQSAVAKIS